MDRKTLCVFLIAIPLILAGCTDADDRKRTADGPDVAAAGGNNTTNETLPDPVTVEVGLSGAYPVTIAYDPAEISVPAGSEVTIRFTNNEENPLPGHDWVLEGHEANASTEVVSNGETSEVTFEAPPVGTYTFYCSVSGHRDNGMEGTFTVA